MRTRKKTFERFPSRAHSSANAKHVLVFKMMMMSTKTIAERLSAHHPLWPSIPTIRDILRDVSSCV